MKKVGWLGLTVVGGALLIAGVVLFSPAELPVAQHSARPFLSEPAEPAGSLPVPPPPTSANSGKGTPGATAAVPPPTKQERDTLARHQLADVRSVAAVGERELLEGGVAGGVEGGVAGGVLPRNRSIEGRRRRPCVAAAS